MQAKLGIDYEALALSPLLVGLAEKEIQALCDGAREARYAAGEALVAEGTAGDSMFLLCEGAVAVEKAAANGQVIQIAVLQESGEFFGEMVFLDVMPRSATIRAQTDVAVLVFDLAMLRDFHHAHKDAYLTITLNIARMLSKRLRKADETIAELQAGKPSTT